MNKTTGNQEILFYLPLTLKSIYWFINEMKWFVTDLIHIDLIYRIYIIQDLLKQFNPMFNFCCLKKKHAPSTYQRPGYLFENYIFSYIYYRKNNKLMTPLFPVWSLHYDDTCLCRFVGWLVPHILPVYDFFIIDIFLSVKK